MTASASTAETLKAGLMMETMRAMHGGTSISNSDIADAVLHESDGAAWKNLQKAVCTYALKMVF